MRLIRWLGPVLFVAGVLTIAFAVVRGEANAYLVVIIPVIVATGPLAFLGIALIFAGFLLTFLLRPPGVVSGPERPDIPTTSPEGASPARRWGGVVFLGPIPVIFGSDPRMTRTMLLVGVILFVALVTLTVLAFFA